MTKYYGIPLQFDTLMERNKELPTCNLGTSIAQNIFLIISTRFYEHRFDATYGCELWDRDFELITNQLVWQEQVSKSILHTLIKHELRLERIKVDTVITEAPYQNPLTRVRSIRKFITVNVMGKIKNTGEDFTYSPQLFLSPISID